MFSLKSPSHITSRSVTSRLVFRSRPVCLQWLLVSCCSQEEDEGSDHMTILTQSIAAGQSIGWDDDGRGWAEHRMALRLIGNRWLFSHWWSRGRPFSRATRTKTSRIGWTCLLLAEQRASPIANLLLGTIKAMAIRLEEWLEAIATRNKKGHRY